MDLHVLTHSFPTRRLSDLFINGELWGKPGNVAWAIIFPRTGDDVARHPSQLYEAGLEGLVLLAVLWFFFWRTKARYDPGKLTGIFLVGYGCARFFKIGRASCRERVCQYV